MSNHEDADVSLPNVAPAEPGSTDVTSPVPAKNESFESTGAVLAKETNPALKDSLEPVEANSRGVLEPSSVAQPSSDPPPEMKSEDAEIKPDVNSDEAPALSSARGTVTATNGTPASAKKGKRKSVSGVPEHKTKKLQKKKSQVGLSHVDAQPGDYFLVKIKGYPPWPAVVADDVMLPGALLSSRPITAKRPDGSWNEPYRDGGKKVAERSFPVMYMGTNEFSWTTNTDLVDYDFTSNEPPKVKGKGLLEAYRFAGEQFDLKHWKNLLVEHQQALNADKERKASKKSTPKGKRKSSELVGDEDEEDVEMPDAADEMEFDGEAAGIDTKSKSKKRKKAVDSDGEAGKATKRVDSGKKGTKLKLSKPKTPNGTPVPKSASKAKAASASKPAKPKGSVKKSAVKVKDSSDEDAVEGNTKSEEKPMTVAELQAKKEKEILWLRHKLQRGFLTRDQMPKEDEMKIMSDYISRLETYSDLEVSIIRATKINKVLKAIIKLPSIPRDEEFNFKTRSHDLLAKWNTLLANEPEASAGLAISVDKAVVNGVGKPSNGIPTATSGEKRESGEEEDVLEAKQESLQTTLVKDEIQIESSGEGKIEPTLAHTPTHEAKTADQQETVEASPIEATA